MSDGKELLAPENYLSFLLGDLKSLCDFAYEHGFHEMGYDPVKEISAFATKAVEELHVVEREIDTPSQALRLLNGGRA